MLHQATTFSRMLVSCVSLEKHELFGIPTAKWAHFCWRHLEDGLLSDAYLRCFNPFKSLGTFSWCHQMETVSMLLALCEGNPPATSGFPSQMANSTGFDVFLTTFINQMTAYKLADKNLKMHKFWVLSPLIYGRAVLIGILTKRWAHFCWRHLVDCLFVPLTLGRNLDQYSWSHLLNSARSWELSVW